MKQSQVKELLLQSLEGELVGERIYATAIACAIHPAASVRVARRTGDTGLRSAQ